MKIAELFEKHEKQKVIKKGIEMLQFNYIADAGSIRFNGINLSNGSGDGEFKFYIIRDEDFEKFNNSTTMKFSNTNVFVYDELKISFYDCKNVIIVNLDVNIAWVYKRGSSFYFSVK